MTTALWVEIADLNRRIHDTDRRIELLEMLHQTGDNNVETFALKYLGEMQSLRDGLVACRDELAADLDIDAAVHTAVIQFEQMLGGVL